MTDLDDVLPARSRLRQRAAADTCQPGPATGFPAPWCSASGFGACDLSILWSDDQGFSADMLSMARLIASCTEHPTAYACGDAVKPLVARWRPALLQTGA